MSGSVSELRLTPDKERSNMKFIKNIVGFAIGFILVSSLFYLIRGGGGKLEEFKPYRSDEGRFSILLPGEPERMVQKVDTPFGALELIMYQAGSKKIGFMVGYADYPQKMFESADIEKMLDDARDGAVQNIQGKLIDEKVLDFHGNPGRELEIKVPNKATIKSRIILIGTRLYQVMVVSESKSALRKNCPKFFESFKVDGLSDD
jgi:hypothetical protein